MQRDMMRTKPVERAGGKRLKELVGAYAQRAKENAGEGGAVPKIKLNANEAPTGEQLLGMLQTGESEQFTKAMNGLNYAGNGGVYPDRDFLRGERTHALVNFNPNADEAYLAHELGHSAITASKTGDMVRRVRDFVTANPKAATALALAGGLTPIAAGAMTPGDDDLDEAILGSIALSSPVLLDEALATKNALAMMEMSGQRATLGQRGKLAGGFLSYLAAPIATGATANFIGNQLDEDI